MMASLFLFRADAAHAVVINEFMAINGSAFLDEDGSSSDWLELFNETGASVDLTGWFLTDDPDTLTRWPIPAVVLDADEYLLVWASAKNRNTPGLPLHANFKLSGGGEYLALVRPGGVTIEHEYSPQFPPQDENISYGLTVDLTAERCFKDPTPAGPNDETPECGNVEPVLFSHLRGFYSAPFLLELTTATPGATIRYTLDGNDPALGSHSVYSAPIPVTTTSFVRARATKGDLTPTDSLTHTYLFLDDVVHQSEADLVPPYPTHWTGGAASDYDMDPEVVLSPEYAATIVEDLKAIPTMSIVSGIDDLFGPENGIYLHVSGHGVKWERPTSMELIYPPAPGEDRTYQINCGIRIQGETSRSRNLKKHSMRLLFKEIYGPTKMEFPLFEDSAVSRFDTITLTGGHGNSWPGGFSSAQYIRDTWIKDTQIAMGRLASASTYVHLYLNGMYWGLYRPTERPDASFMAEHLGGEKEEYDALNAGRVTDGSVDAWSTALDLSREDLSIPANMDALAEYVDQDSLIDFMVSNIYAANYDWDFKNWYGGRHRVPGAGYKFFSWDGEETFGSANGNRTKLSNANAPSSLYSSLRKESKEFQVLFGDHLHRHLFNGGTLTPKAAADRWMTRAREIDRAIVGESARWGDKARSQPYTRDVEWLIEQNRLLLSFFPARSAVILEQFRKIDLYPEVEAPAMSQFGGDFDQGFALSLSAPAGIMYFTDDGSDPRLPGGAISPSAELYTGSIPLVGSSRISTRAQSGVEWSALVSADFVPSAIRISEIHYHPLGDEGLEYVEVTNTSNGPWAIQGFSFTDGIEFTFPFTIVGVGQTVVVASDPTLFSAHYGLGIPVAGQYTGRLSNGGERLVLKDERGGVLHDFVFRDHWYPSTDGGGYSLVVRDLDAPRSMWADATGWRASAHFDGSAGSLDLPLCDDGVDNDGDGLTDYGADPGCATPQQDTENPACDDGADNDADALVDGADGDCSDASDDREAPDLVDSFLCYQVRRTKTAPQLEPSTVTLDDSVVGLGDFLVRKRSSVCAVGTLNDTPLVDEEISLQGFDLKDLPESPPRAAQEGVVVENAFGRMTIDLSKSDRILFPATVSLDGPTATPVFTEHGIDHFKCYRTHKTSGAPKYFPRSAQANFADMFETRGYRVKKSRYLCAPADTDGSGIKNGQTYMMCYTVRYGKRFNKHEGVTPVYTASDLGPDQLETRKEKELCIPSTVVSGLP